MNVEESMIERQPNNKVPSGRRFLSVLAVLFVLALGITIGTIISYNGVKATGAADSRLEMQSGGKPVGGGAD